MKKFNFTLCVFLLLSLFVSCERPDYSDEIYDNYREAERLSTSGAVIDGNMWSARSRGVLDWDEAVSYCKNLTELGHYDWRLPKLNELRTLIRDCPYTEIGGSCNFDDDCLEDEFENDTYCASNNCGCPYGYSSNNNYSKLDDGADLWSSTLRRSDEAWHIDFLEARVLTDFTRYYNYVRCVR
ncbi:DUF1566 domain-containing protein [bacterium]|nr:DUF1566 domain-containing protein [bacterium]